MKTAQPYALCWNEYNIIVYLTDYCVDYKDEHTLESDVNWWKTVWYYNELELRFNALYVGILVIFHDRN